MNLRDRQRMDLMDIQLHIFNKLSDAFTISKIV